MLVHTFLCMLFTTKSVCIYFPHLSETIAAFQVWHVLLLLAVILPGESGREEIRAIPLFTSPIVFCSPVLLFGKEKLRHSGVQSKSGRGEMRRRYHCWYSTNWFCKVTHKTSLVTLPFPPSHNPLHLPSFVLYLSSLSILLSFPFIHLLCLCLSTLLWDIHKRKAYIAVTANFFALLKHADGTSISLPDNVVCVFFCLKRDVFITSSFVSCVLDRCNSGMLMLIMRWETRIKWVEILLIHLNTLHFWIKDTVSSIKTE